MQVLPVFRAQASVEFVSYHFIRAALGGKEFSAIVISETDVADDIYAAFASFDNGRNERNCIKSRRLDEYTFFGIAKCGKPSFILRSINVVVIRCCVDRISRLNPLI